MTSDHPLPLCQYCDQPFFRSHGQQKFCRRNGLACQKKWRVFQIAGYQRWKRLDAQVGRGRGATRQLTNDQGWHCAACHDRFPVSPSKRAPHALIRVWKTPQGAIHLVCPPCLKALHGLYRTGQPLDRLLAAARLETTPSVALPPPVAVLNNDPRERVVIDNTEIGPQQPIS